VSFASPHAALVAANMSAEQIFFAGSQAVASVGSHGKSAPQGEARSAPSPHLPLRQT